MAGNWIKIEHITPDKPEIVRMAEALHIDQDAVLGKCLRLWIWADQQTISAADLIVTPSFLDRLTNCAGFSEKLLEVGWLKSRNGRFSLPHFDRHNGQTAKNRALSADRMARQRYAQNVTETAPDLELDKEKNKKKAKRVLGSVDPGNLIPANPDPPNIGATLATIQKAKEFAFLEDGTYPYLKADIFAVDWAAWLDMRRKMKVDNGARALVLALNKLHLWPLEKAVLALQLSVERGYRGVFEPNGSDNGRNSYPPTETMLQPDFLIPGVRT